MPRIDPRKTPTASRRGFLKGLGLSATGLVGASALDPAQAASLFRGLPGHLPQEAAHVDQWLRHVASESSPAVGGSGDYHKSVEDFAKLIESNGIVRMYVTEMIDQVPDANKTIHSIDELLAALDHIVGTAPEYNSDPKKRNTFPVSSLFVYMMYTPAGLAGFANEDLNDAIRNILKEWSAYLDSADSRSVLNTGPNGWLSSSAFELNKLDEFIIPDKSAPHWGFDSFNAYFHRQIRAEARPIASPNDRKVVVSANDGTVYKIARNVKRSDRFWVKSQPYSLVNILDGHPGVDAFVGGDVFQSFLSGADYHRWHAPIDGTVVDTKTVNGLMFSELNPEGFDPTAGTYSQGYEASVNTRGLVFIESEDSAIGTVCVIPIGITEISSVTIEASIGDKVKKGEELGYFSYGGSSMCLVFQPGAIRRFVVEGPKPGGDPDGGPPIKVNAEIALAN